MKIWFLLFITIVTISAACADHAEKFDNTKPSSSPKLSRPKDTSILYLNEGITLIGVIKKFEKTEHRIDTCLDDFKNKYICKIDDKPWYGMDRGLMIPENQLSNLVVIIDSIKISLEVSQMFNPSFSYYLKKDQFTLKRNADEYELFGFFSDGAGTYEASWKIKNGKSRRTALYNPGY